MKVFQKLAHNIGWLKALEADDNAERSREWLPKAEESIQDIMRSAPSGSGIDCGTTLDIENSSSEKIILTFGFHHLNHNGYYDGWTQHKAVVRPSLRSGITIHISGRNRAGVKDYLYEVFYAWLISEIVD